MKDKLECSPSRVAQAAGAQGYETVAVDLSSAPSEGRRIVKKGPFYGWQIISGENTSVLVQTGQITNQGGTTQGQNELAALFGSGLVFCEDSPAFNELSIRYGAGLTGTLLFIIYVTRPACLPLLTPVVLRDASGNTVSTTNPLPVVFGGTTGPTDLTPAAPATVTVGAASGLVLAARTGRRFVYFRNTSTGGQRISLNWGGAAAVLDSGHTLKPDDWVSLDKLSLQFDITLAINGIASAAGGTLAIQEGT